LEGRWEQLFYWLYKIETSCAGETGRVLSQFKAASLVGSNPSLNNHGMKSLSQSYIYSGNTSGNTKETYE